MLNRNIAGVIAAGLLLVAGGVNAAEGVFPASSNETASSPHKYQGAVKPAGTNSTIRPSRSAFPASPNETA